MRGQGMEICHHKITGIFFLQLYIIAHGAKIVAKVEEPRGPDSTHNDCVPVFHRAKIINVKEAMKQGRNPFHSSIKCISWLEMN
jgi:hypothetical protein